MLSSDCKMNFQSDFWLLLREFFMKKILTLFFVCIILFHVYTLFSANKIVQLERIFQAGIDQAIDWLWRPDSNRQLYPFVKLEFGQLTFLEKNGSVFKRTPRLPYSNVVTSPNQDFIGAVEIVGENTLAVDDKLFHYRIFSWNGIELFTIEKMKPYDEPLQAIYLFNDGGALLTDGARGSFELYRKNGHLNQRIVLFDDTEFDYEKPIECVIPENDDVFFVVTQKRPMTRDGETKQLVSGEPWIFCFTRDGEELWRKSIDHPTFSRVSASPAGQYIIISHHSLMEDDSPVLGSTVFDSDGNSILEIPINFRTSAFSADERQLFLADKKNVYSVDLAKRSVQKIYSVPETEDRFITKILVEDSGKEVIALIAQSVFQNNRFEFIEADVRKISSTGQVMWHIDLRDDVFVTPSIHIFKSQIAIGCNSNFKLFRENRD